MALTESIKSTFRSNKLAKTPYLCSDLNTSTAVYGIANQPGYGAQSGNPGNINDTSVIGEEVRIATYLTVFKLQKEEKTADIVSTGRQNKTFSTQSIQKCKDLLHKAENSLIVQWLTKNCNFGFIQCILHVILLLLFSELAQLLYLAESWTQLFGSSNAAITQILLLVLMLFIFCIWLVMKGDLPGKSQNVGDPKSKADISVKEKEHLTVSTERKGYTASGNITMTSTAPSSKRPTYTIQTIAEDAPILENEWINITTSDATHQLSGMESQGQTVSVDGEDSETKVGDSNEDGSKNISSYLWCCLVFASLIYIIATNYVICVHCIVQCSCLIALSCGLCYCLI